MRRISLRNVKFQIPPFGEIFFLDSLLHTISLTISHCLLMLRSGLLYCMEYLEDNIQDWLSEELESFGEDDYLVFDCPGQIELYSHVPVFRTLVNFLQVRTIHINCSSRRSQLRV